MKRYKRDGRRQQAELAIQASLLGEVHIDIADQVAPEIEDEDIDWEVVEGEIASLSYDLVDKLWAKSHPFEDLNLRRFKELQSHQAFWDIVEGAYKNGRIQVGLAI